MSEDKFEKILNGKSTLQKIGLHAIEELNRPLENLLNVSMGQAGILIPESSNYIHYDGLKTGALATCIGVALYVPQEIGAIVGIAHKAPSQPFLELLNIFFDQLRKSDIDINNLRKLPGFFSVVAGQTLLDRGFNEVLDKTEPLEETLKELFPKFKTFPFSQITYSVLRGHQSASLKLLKDGRLSILGEGREY